MKQSIIEELLNQPLKDGIELFYKKSDSIIQDIQSQLQEDNSDRKTLGQQLSQIKKLQKQIANLEILNWIDIDSGKLAIGHRPSKKLIGYLKLQGCTHILTLLSESEGAKETEYLCGCEHINWLWYSMDNAKINSHEENIELINLFKNLENILSNNGSIYIHCSAGIHRTGMIAFALLHYFGYSTDESLDLLKQLRVETFENMGEERKEWGKTICKSEVI